jgi:hypothetical protein
VEISDIIATTAAAFICSIVVIPSVPAKDYLIELNSFQLSPTFCKE